MPRRIERLQALLRQEISQLLQRRLKDPRLANGLVSITGVEILADLSEATIFVSVLGTPEEQAAVLAGLTSARGYIWHELRSRLDLRTVPTITFQPDHSLERGAHLLELMRQLETPPDATP